MGFLSALEQTLDHVSLARGSDCMPGQNVGNSHARHPAQGARSQSIDRYPAKAHIQRVVANLPKPYKSSHIVLTGSDLIPLGLSDEFHEFLQESNFYYCTGSDRPNWFLLYSIPESKLTVFVPKPITGRMVAYLGQSETTEEVLEHYDVDAVHYHESFGSLLEMIPAIFYTLKDEDLVLALTRARRVKDETELKLMRKASSASSLAHLMIARGLGRNRYKSEAEVESDFRAVCASRGAKRQSYAPIIGSGTNASMLHYSTNNQDFGNAELVLIDAAGSVDGYRSDITRTYPIHGKFSNLGRQLYALVLRMQVDAIRMLKPGVKMIDLQNYCHRLLAEKMVEWNWVNCSLEKCVELELSQVFLMHGLGHQIGLDTHDVELWTESASSNQSIASIKRENLGRLVSSDSVKVQAPLDAGNVVTVEPGVYFNEYYLTLFYKNPDLGKYYNQDVIRKWAHLGGARIEDCVLITEHGYELLSTMRKEIEEIEAICSGEEDS